MLDENEHSRKEDGRSLHRLLHKAEQQDATVVVDSAAFFSELPPEQAAPPRRPQQNTPRSTVPGANGAYQPPKRGKILLIVQAILSVLALVQLWRTQMLPVLYLVVLAALLVLLWLLVKRCQEYKTAGTVSRAFSVVLCAAMAGGCVWAQQGLDALGNMTNGFLSNAEANKITKEPFVLYLSGVDTRGDLTEKARSDVNIIAAVNPVTKQVVLINTPRDYYVDLAGTNSKDKLTHAGLYGVQTSMDTLGNLYGVNVEHYIRRILEKTRYQDQANKICSGILNFARKVGPDRLAAACRLADSYGKYSFREIQDILQNKSEAIDLPEEPADMPEHENIRGKEYYK